MGPVKPGVQRVLALNCGSSSLKFGLFETGNQPALLLEGEAEEIGGDESTFWTRSSQDKQKSEQRVVLKDHEAALRQTMQALQETKLDGVDAIGHRIVHGGPKLREHQRLNDQALAMLKRATEFAPLHMPASLAVIDAASKAWPGKAQVICLDTAFHKDMPDVARTLALPAEVRSMGVERYGFHGLSLESIVAQIRQVPQRMVVAHLGNGSSITAVHAGKSIDTSMGLTPTGGVMMGSRTGDLDPGVLIYLMRHGYSTAERLEELVDKQSGLKGISRSTSDVRELTKKRENESAADLALRLFAYQVRKCIAGMAAAMGGMDLLVFTGGIGEHDGEMRVAISEGLQFCGKYDVKVLPAQEELQIARITAKILTS